MLISEAYNEWSATYDSDHNLTRDLDHAVLENWLDGKKFGTTLELGCGTGKNTALLASASGHLVAVDFSAGMIAQARAKLSLPNIEFLIADIMKPWTWASASFDLISCNLVLEHVEDLTHVFREASRVMDGGARFLVCELHPYRQYAGTQARFQRGAQMTMIPAFVHHISDFAAAAINSGLSIEGIKEWWHLQDEGKPPRLISFVFTKPPK